MIINLIKYLIQILKTEIGQVLEPDLARNQECKFEFELVITPYR